jgi:hypothetical protein
MIENVIPVQIRSRDASAPLYPCSGIVPYLGSPLAVASDAIYSALSKKWEAKGGWIIVHVPTGYALGHEVTWNTQEEAMAVLMACDPAFAAWPLANGDMTGDAATKACKYKFKVANGTT